MMASDIGNFLSITNRLPVNTRLLLMIALFSIIRDYHLINKVFNDLTKNKFSWDEKTSCNRLKSGSSSDLKKKMFLQFFAN